MPCIDLQQATDEKVVALDSNSAAFSHFYDASYFARSLRAFGVEVLSAEAADVQLAQGNATATTVLKGALDGSRADPIQYLDRCIARTGSEKKDRS
jgi:hypothetical protein